MDTNPQLKRILQFNTGKPDAMKVARPVWRRTVGKVPTFGRQLAGSLSYVRRLTASLNTTLSVDRFDVLWPVGHRNYLK